MSSSASHHSSAMGKKRAMHHDDAASNRIEHDDANASAHQIMNAEDSSAIHSDSSTAHSDMGHSDTTSAHHSACAHPDDAHDDSCGDDMRKIHDDHSSNMHSSIKASAHDEASSACGENSDTTPTHDCSGSGGHDDGHSCSTPMHSSDDAHSSSDFSSNDDSHSDCSDNNNNNTDHSDNNNNSEEQWMWMYFGLAELEVVGGVAVVTLTVFATMNTKTRAVCSTAGVTRGRLGKATHFIKVNKTVKTLNNSVSAVKAGPTNVNVCHDGSTVLAFNCSVANARDGCMNGGFRAGGGH